MEVQSLKTSTITKHLTANNFIGFSDAAYSDGATATIQIEGSVDDAQSGLTTAKTHYVQNDGTLQYNSRHTISDSRNSNICNKNYY